MAEREIFKQSEIECPERVEDVLQFYYAVGNLIKRAVSVDGSLHTPNILKRVILGKGVLIEGSHGMYNQSHNMGMIKELPIENMDELSSELRQVLINTGIQTEKNSDCVLSAILWRGSVTLPVAWLKIHTKNAEEKQKGVSVLADGFQLKVEQMDGEEMNEIRAGLGAVLLISQIVKFAYEKVDEYLATIKDGSDSHSPQTTS